MTSSLKTVTVKVTEIGLAELAALAEDTYRTVERQNRYPYDGQAIDKARTAAARLARLVPNQPECVEPDYDYFNEDALYEQHLDNKAWERSLGEPEWAR